MECHLLLMEKYSVAQRTTSSLIMYLKIECRLIAGGKLFSGLTNNFKFNNVVKMECRLNANGELSSGLTNNIKFNNVVKNGMALNRKWKNIHWRNKQCQT